MATSVDWITGEITVPRADMMITQVSPEIRELNVETWHLELRDLEASTNGMPWPDTHAHTAQNGEVAPQVTIKDPYFVTFENGVYAVNLVGANNNVADFVTLNNVQIRSNNSSGLIVYEAATSGLTPAESTVLMTTYSYILGGREIDFVGNDAQGWQRIQRDENGAEVARYNLFDQDLNRITGSVTDYLNNRTFIRREVRI